MFITRVSKDANNIRLTHWAIVEADDGRHFVGTDNTDLVGLTRVSTKISNFDMKTMTGVTGSGRTYILVYEPAGLIGRNLALWEDWASLYKVETWKDVTEEYTSVAQ